MNNRAILLGGALVFVVLAGVFYYKNVSGSNPQILPATAMELKEFAVAGSNFKFEPSVIKVKKGDTVKITFTNSGGMHDFVLDEFNVKSKRIGLGEKDSVQFVADKTGSFQYYCSVGKHRAQGMWGTLKVEN